MSPTPAERPAEIIRRMAEIMRDMRGAQRTCDDKSLAVEGDFTMDEVARYGDKARDLAIKLSTRRIDRKPSPRDHAPFLGDGSAGNRIGGA